MTETEKPSLLNAAQEILGSADPVLLKDQEIFRTYEELISSSYPAYLRKIGLSRTAVKAEGATITDSAGTTYIDCVGGYGLFNIGHNHPRIIQDLIAQLNEKQLLTKPFITENQVRLARMLAEVMPGDLICSFITNSGSEAIDSAIKLSRLCSGKRRIIAAQNSFHGYTFGALSASGIHSFGRFFAPLVPEIVHIPFGDIKALREAVTVDTAAVLLEPIQHEAGIFIPAEDYFPEVRSICDDKGIILILDEVKTGFGKTGWMFACEKFGIVPDILVAGKSMGGGMIPIGSVIARKKLWKKFSLSFPMSASSFAGNALACRAALSTIEIIQQDNLLEECKNKGFVLLKELRQCVKEYSAFLKDVKGMGLLLGVEATNARNASRLSKSMISQGVIMVTAFGNASALMIEPPIVITFEQILRVTRAFKTACERLSQDKGEIDYADL